MESNTGNAGDKKQVWKKPDNGIVETGPVMSYAVSWPALSESTRLPPKSTLESSASVTGPCRMYAGSHRHNSRCRHGTRCLMVHLWGQRQAFSLEGHNNWEGRPIGGFGSQSQSVNDFSLQRNQSRRDTPPRGFLPPSRPPVSNPFIRPHSVMPFGKPMGFEMTYPFPYGPTRPWESFGGQPFNAQVPPPMSFPIQDNTLPNSLVNQIEYITSGNYYHYFSLLVIDANLVKDEFLRSKMDDEGWVPIDLIAGFPRVQGLTKNIELILNSVRASSIVEIKCNKLRRRNDWRRWICRSGRFPTGSNSLGLANGECVNEGASSSQL
ncbi:hypothetical protein Acr_00g0005510 [Actinidia rufa]|uniref:HTH La-type RNA-binding domain-containing protein n=1 Tax=Actinidia rufa TaxID=165716 RepID=A0A7J0D7U3_9ERIC|nr:hypothetical protein Acr_00g0005510 [Actinidia rufa]